MIPTYEEFQQYAFERIKGEKDDPRKYTDFIKSKYDAWTIAGWKKEVKGRFVKIQIWKTTLIQSLIHRVPNKVNDLKVRAEVLKPTGKMKSIEDEEIITAFNRYKVMQNLLPPHDECYGYLLERGIFKKGNEISDKTGKPWQEWYNKLTTKALPLAVAYAMDKNIDPKERNQIRNGNHPIAEKFVKLEALKTFFGKFENEDRLKMGI